MAAFVPTDERYPANRQRTFTDFTGGLTLHSTSAPALAQHLPSLLIVQAEATDVLAWTDVDGVTNTITFTAATAGLHQLRIPAVTLTAACTVTAVTVCWNERG